MNGFFRQVDLSDQVERKHLIMVHYPQLTYQSLPLPVQEQARQYNLGELTHLPVRDTVNALKVGLLLIVCWSIPTFCGDSISFGPSNWWTKGMVVVIVGLPAIIATILYANSWVNRDSFLWIYIFQKGVIFYKKGVIFYKKGISTAYLWEAIDRVE